jgi:hypothetical protein
MEHFYKDEKFGDAWFGFDDIYKMAVERFPTGSHFVEVGSWKGRSAAFMAVEIINSGKQIKFDCVDSWAEEGYNPCPDLADFLIATDPMLRETFSRHKEIFLMPCKEAQRLFIENIVPVKDHITVIHSTSVQAANLYANHSLDFVYLDAAHDYNSVKADIQAWEPKIKKGGILAGDDFVADADGQIGWPSVIKAVIDSFGDKAVAFGRSWMVQL